MTVGEAVRLLDPATRAEAINEIRYYEKVKEVINEACKLACDIMRKYEDDIK